ncbi:PTS sugar transporter subunit IIB [Neobacillus sp. OS1-32]|jgi:PTS system ascorbate-specific IIB component|uniref:PTS sugar transporter subunit IIB n=1 Tax=Neobacillus paridis TaxID=2803862 RepID=A0ABS1TTK4_9BACI|nr:MULTISPECIES: PTS sugar transporter subunit IIB [Neobacillus]MBL4954650.1 PTS sugar transporter subunit IIB [Neobacillus paridis]WML29934.1 PTS sugar transporter subunit IIB [Neobacillus sp. OS1-32]
MKILVVCGNGLGSSFMMSMNVQKAMKELNIEGTCSHTDLASAKTENADYYIGSPEIMDQLNDGKRKTIPLVNMFSLEEIKKALTTHILKG